MPQVAAPSCRVCPSPWPPPAGPLCNAQELAARLIFHGEMLATEPKNIVLLVSIARCA